MEEIVPRRTLLQGASPAAVVGMIGGKSFAHSANSAIPSMPYTFGAADKSKSSLTNFFGVVRRQSIRSKATIRAVISGRSNTFPKASSKNHRASSSAGHQHARRSWLQHLPLFSRMVSRRTGRRFLFERGVGTLPPHARCLSRTQSHHASPLFPRLHSALVCLQRWIGSIPQPPIVTLASVKKPPNASAISWTTLQRSTNRTFRNC